MGSSQSKEEKSSNPSEGIQMKIKSALELVLVLNRIVFHIQIHRVLIDRRQIRTFPTLIL